MKWLAASLAFILVAGIWILFDTAYVPSDLMLDKVEVNNVVKYIEENWGGKLPDSPLKYTIIKNNESLSGAIAHRDTIVDINVDGKVVGKAVFNNNTDELLKAARDRFMAICFTTFALLTAACIFFTIFLKRTILTPFKKLETFAGSVAAGNLELPLDMDRRNRFGAFTESFDLMRVQLAAARENERLANESKKELVASLSHDIKTPIASIKAVSELMIAKGSQSAELHTIISKADQVDLLITNMFHATMEELSQLKVEPKEIESTVLYEVVQNADYNKKVKPFTIPECIVSADRMRLQQVFDNIINNSYKYAGTEIEITAGFEGSYLAVEVKDFGCGVLDEELPLLFEKFFRAGNANDKSGSGLGLFISKYFMNQMHGDIECDNRNGFTVYVFIKI